MAWNQPTGAAQPPRKAPSKLRGLVAFLILVALAGGAAWYLFMPKAEKKVERGDDKTRLIKDIGKTTAKAAETNSTETAAKPKTPVDPREDYDHEKLYRDEHGILRHKLGNLRAPDPTRPRAPEVSSETQHRTIFENKAERAIARLIQTEPSSVRYTYHDYYDPSYEKAFMEALLSPTKAKEDDLDYDKRLKECVAGVVKDVADRIKKGEKLGDILTEADKELRRLADYSKSLKSQISDIVKNGQYSTDEVKDLVAAANKMLEEKGINPIEDEDFVKWNLRMTARREGNDPIAAVREYEANQREKEKNEQE